MKKLILLTAAATVALGAFAFQKALYVKQGDSFSKFNFGVAGDLKFFNNGHSLKVTGYDEVIDLDKIDYISFTAPVEGTALTPSAQKERLISIGHEINNAFNIHDEENLVLLMDEFLYGFEDPQNYEYYRIFRYNWPANFGEPKDNPATALMQAASKLVRGNSTQALNVATHALEVHKASDLSGVFTAEHATKSWVKLSDADYFEMRYRRLDSQRDGYFAVRVEWSGNEWTWNTSAHSIVTPEKLTVTFMENSTTLGRMEITTAMVQDQKIDLKLNFAGNVTQVAGNINMRPDGIAFDLTESFRGKYFSTQKGRIDGSDLLDYDKLKADYDLAQDQELYDPEYVYIEGDKRPFISHLKRAHMDVDVLGLIQANGRIYNLVELYDDKGYPETEEFTLPNGQKIVSNYEFLVSLSSDKTRLSTTEDNLELDYIPVQDFLNNKSDVQFSYDGNGQTQGFLSFETDSEEDSWTRDETSRYNQGYFVQNGKVMSAYPKYEFDEYGEKIIGYNVYDQKSGKEVDVPADCLIFPLVDTDVYYDITPKIVFSDLTSFYIADFFTADAFGSNINDYNALIDAYFAITGHERHNGYIK